MFNYSELHDKLEFIEKHAILINDELGEYWRNIVSLGSCTPEIFDNEFLDAYHLEVDDIYNYIRENARIVSTPETIEVISKRVEFDD